VYQEIIPSIGDQYPYPIQALFFYMGSPVYALPAGHKLIEILRDVEKLPLFVCSDIVVGETSMYADYIFPDLTYLERWEFHSSHPSFPMKNEPIRQPAIPPLTETVQVFGNEMPISLEALLLAIAEEMNLPGFGPNGFGNGMPFTRGEHLYLKMVANVAAGTKEGNEVPDASDEELAIFRTARKHLPKTVFDEEVWKQACGEKWWRKVVYVLNRGGRFQEFAKMYKGDYLANPYGKLINLYSEKAATSKHPATGKPFSGVARYYEPYVDYAGNALKDESEGYTFKLITHREIFHTKSRTASNYWLLALMPESSILMNQADADRLGLKDGDEIRLISPSNPDGEWDFGNGMKRPLVGKVKTIQGIRPGIITFPLGFGHWAYGSNDIVVDGQVIRRDERRGKGIHANAAMRVDPILGNTPLSDPVGASVAFYDSMVKVVKEA
jgi:anaerobic selenocysteine-containing dehydrogenase